MLARTHRRRLGRIVTAAGLALAGVPLLAGGAAAQDNVDNPDLTAACGLDLTLVLDRSTSIGNDNADVRDAGQALLDVLAGTGSFVKVVTFGDTANGLGSSGSGASYPGHYTSGLGSIVFRDPAGITLPALPSSGSTNWDDALETVRRSSGGPGELVVVVTDGNPTIRLSNGADDGTAQDGHGGGTSTDGDAAGTSAAELGEAQDEADAIQAAGSHLFVIGVGAALTDPASVARIESISGEDELDDSFATADYTLTEDFSALGGLLRGMVTELCTPSLNVRKLEAPPSGDAQAAVGGAGWEISATLGYTPSAWETPGGAAGTSASTLTDEQGFANFNWSAPGDLRTDIVFTEPVRPDFEFQSVGCTRTDFVNAPVPVAVGVEGPIDGQLVFTLAGSSDLGPQEAMNCTIVNRRIALSTIQVDKQTQPAIAGAGFDFQLRGGGDAVLDTLGGVTGPGQGAVAFATGVLPGTYSVTETPVDGWTPFPGTCTAAGRDPAPATAIPVLEGETWTCTFVNEADGGTLTIVKEARGVPVGDFTFASTVPGHERFVLGTTATALGSTTGTASVTFPVEATATGDGYAIDEIGADGFELVSATCSNGSPIDEVRVGPDEAVVCTFVNEAPEPTIEVVKTALDTTIFDETDSTYRVTITNTSLDTVTVTLLTDRVEGVPVDLPSLTELCGADRTLAPGETLVCRFTLVVGPDDDLDGDGLVEDLVTVVAVDAGGNASFDRDDAAVELLGPEVLGNTSTRGTGTGRTGGSLPRSGSDARPFLLVSGVLLALGGAFLGRSVPGVAVVRRRRP